MAVQTEPVTKVSDKLKGMLNDAISREIAVGIQYMWQHVQVMGGQRDSCAGSIQADGHYRDEACGDHRRKAVVSHRNSDYQTCIHQCREQLEGISRA